MFGTLVRPVICIREKDTLTSMPQLSGQWLERKACWDGREQQDEEDKDEKVLISTCSFCHGVGFTFFSGNDSIVRAPEI